MADPVNDEQFLKIVESCKTQVEAAKVLGISKQAVNSRIKKIRSKTTQSVVTGQVRQIDTIVQDKLDTMGQLVKSNKYANELLDACMSWTRGDPEAIQVLENTRRRIRLGVKGGPDGEEGNGFKWVDEFKFKDPREIALKAMAEIRHQLKLQFDMFSTIFSLKQAELFQAAIIEEIRMCEPDVAKHIVERLHSKQAIRRIIEQPGPGNGV